MLSIGFDVENRVLSITDIFLTLKAVAKYPYFPGQEPTLTGHVDSLLQVFLRLQFNSIY